MDETRPTGNKQTMSQGSMQVRAPALPLALAAQLFSAFSPKDLQKEDVAAALLRLSRNNPGNDAAKLEIDALAQELAMRGSTEEAEALVRQAVTHELVSTGAQTPRSLALQVALADLLHQQGKTAEARRLFVKSVELQRQTLGTQHPQTLRTLEKLAVLLVEQGELRYAEPLLCEAVLVRRAQQGDGHEDTLRALSALGYLLLRQNKDAEAEPLLRQCLQAQRRLLGKTHADTRATLNYLAQVTEKRGNVHEAEMSYVLGLGAAKTALGPNNLETLGASFALSGFLMRQHRAGEALHMLRNLLPLARRVCQGRTQFLLDIEAHLGACFRQLGDYARAERHLTRSFERGREVLGLAHTTTQYGLSELIALYDAWGKPKQAAPYRQTHDACS